MLKISPLSPAMTIASGPSAGDAFRSSRVGVDELHRPAQRAVRVDDVQAAVARADVHVAVAVDRGRRADRRRACRTASAPRRSRDRARTRCRRRTAARSSRRAARPGSRRCGRARRTAHASLRRSRRRTRGRSRRSRRRTTRPSRVRSGLAAIVPSVPWLPRRRAGRASIANVLLPSSSSRLLLPMKRRPRRGVDRAAATTSGRRS